MKRSDLEHILRASKAVTGETEFIILGSQSILGHCPDAPRALRQSMEADVYPLHRPELSIEIEGSLGRYSQFAETFGYFADGVGPETAILAPGWEKRLVRVQNENTEGAIGWCIDPHDLAISKMAARREKDVLFVAQLLRFHIIQRTKIEELMETLNDESLRTRLQEAWVICRRHSLMHL